MLPLKYTRNQLIDALDSRDAGEFVSKDLLEAATQYESNLTNVNRSQSTPTKKKTTANRQVKNIGEIISFHPKKIVPVVWKDAKGKIYTEPSELSMLTHAPVWVCLAVGRQFQLGRLRMGRYDNFLQDVENQIIENNPKILSSLPIFSNREINVTKAKIIELFHILEPLWRGDQNEGGRPFLASIMNEFIQWVEAKPKPQNSELN